MYDRGVWRLLLVLTACGRLGFDATSSRASDGAVDVSRDAAMLVRTEITASNADPGDEFGLALAFSRDGSTIAVGAPREDSKATGVGGDPLDNTMADSGAAYVFVRSGGGWAQQAYLKAAVAKQLDAFGSALALSADGNTLAVGEYLCDGGAPASGCVELFTRTGTSWTFLQRVTESSPDQDDLFGITVALSDDGGTLVVGAQQEASSATTINGNQLDNSSPSQGAAFVFVRSGSTYLQQAYLKAPNGQSNDGFGDFVACSGDGNTVAISAFGEASGIPGDPTDNSRPSAGAVYQFTRTGGVWTFTSYIKAPAITTGDFFGEWASLSRDGSRLVVGAPGSDVFISNGGAVDVYTLGPTATFEQTLSASTPGDNDQLGTSVAMSSDGATLFAGTANFNASTGAAYRFVRTGATWDDVEMVQRTAPVAGDQFGTRIAVTDDARVYAVCAFNANAGAGAVTVTYFGQ